MHCRFQRCIAKQGTDNSGVRRLRVQVPFHSSRLSVLFFSAPYRHLTCVLVVGLRIASSWVCDCLSPRACTRVSAGERRHFLSSVCQLPTAYVFAIAGAHRFLIFLLVLLVNRFLIFLLQVSTGFWFSYCRCQQVSDFLIAGVNMFLIFLLQVSTGFWFSDYRYQQACGLCHCKCPKYWETFSFVFAGVWNSVIWIVRARKIGFIFHCRCSKVYYFVTACVHWLWFCHFRCPQVC